MEDEEVQTRHRKEKKELLAKTQAMKKNAGKKNKRDVHAEIEKLEKELEAKHLDELKKLTINEPPLPATEEAHEETHRVSKAQKRREKKDEKERERQSEIEREAELNKFGPRNVENSTINELLKKRQLMIFPIDADGDCLYNSIAHQLKVTGRTAMGVRELRNLTADYILGNKENLLPYMTNDADESLNDDEFVEYCEKLRRTKCWGGQIEIMALSNALKVPIEVLQATGPPTVQSADTFDEPNLVLTYHRHFVSLGEHYNSTQPLVISEED